MKLKKKVNSAERSSNIKVVENMPSYDHDPVFLKKREEAIKALTENPPPAWIQKRMRGED
jgi:hypothetical protein